MIDYHLEFLKALLLSVIVETACLYGIVRFAFKVDQARLSHWRLLSAGILATCTTLPYLWFLVPRFIQSRALYVVVCETSAVVIETAILALILHLSLVRAVLASFLCNLASFGLGMLLRLTRG